MNWSEIRLPICLNSAIFLVAILETLVWSKWSQLYLWPVTDWFNESYKVIKVLKLSFRKRSECATKRLRIIKLFLQYMVYAIDSDLKENKSVAINYSPDTSSRKSSSYWDFIYLVNNKLAVVIMKYKLNMNSRQLPIAFV